MPYSEEKQHLEPIGRFPKDYKYGALRDLPIYSQAVLQNLKNQQEQEFQFNKFFAKYKTRYATERAKAKEKGLLDDIDRCVESGLRVQLLIRYPSHADFGIEGECCRWKHHDKIFTNWLRGDGVRESMSKYFGASIIIPDELLEEISKEDLKDEEEVIF